jgi:hypothetical protein
MQTSLNLARPASQAIDLAVATSAFILQMLLYLVNERLILYTSNHRCFTATLLANRHINVEYPLQALSQGHGFVALCGCLVFAFLSDTAFTALGRCHIDSMFAVGCEHSMEPGQVDSWLGNQGRQSGDDIQGLEYDMGGSIT